MLEHKGEIRPSDEEILYAQKDRLIQAHSPLLHSAKISAYILFAVSTTVYSCALHLFVKSLNTDGCQQLHSLSHGWKYYFKKLVRQETCLRELRSSLLCLSCVGNTLNWMLGCGGGEILI